MLDVTKVPSPCYVMEEDLLRKNLSLIKVWQNVPVWKLFLLSSFCHVEIVSDIP